MAKIKGVGGASLDAGISIIIAGVALASVVAGISWLYDQHTYKKFFDEYSIYGIAIREYYKDAPFLKGNSLTVSINLESIKKAGLLPKSQNISKISKYGFSALVYRDRILFNIRQTDEKLCLRIIQAINNKVLANKISYLRNQNNTRLYSQYFYDDEQIKPFCEVSTSIRIAELIIRNQL